jgi:hypothetical protein
MEVAITYSRLSKTSGQGRTKSESIIV